jgi:hypothetical protein
LNQKVEGLISILKKTSKRIKGGAPFHWTHQGHCNCGHLAQTVTGLEAGEVHKLALSGEGEWRHHAQQYCETSGLGVDELIERLLAVGLSLEELAHLELLSDPEIVEWLPSGNSYLNYRSREDAVLYFDTWIEVLIAKQKLRSNPKEEALVNGRSYQLSFKSEYALDENPVVGELAYAH